MQFKSVVASAALAVCLGVPHLFAFTPPEGGRDLARLVERSNLVFVGTADKVVYRNARGGPGTEATPYTFVTYRIERVVRGTAPGPEITLRFIGGTDGHGRFLAVTGVPLIGQGARDLLFVESTSNANCPLVDCERGRYRILGEQVFDSGGSPVREIVKEEIVVGGVPPLELRTVRFPAPTFGELMQNPEAAQLVMAGKISVAEARRAYEENAPKFIEVTDHYAVDAKQDGEVAKEVDAPEPLALATLLAATEDIAKRAERATTEVRSVDPAADLVAPSADGVAPPEMAETSRVQRSPEDEAEYQALSENKFNPVLPKRRNR